MVKKCQWTDLNEQSFILNNVGGTVFPGIAVMPQTLNDRSLRVAKFAIKELIIKFDKIFLFVMEYEVIEKSIDGE